MSGVTPADAGLASGVVNTSMQVGGAFGLAVLATLATDRTEVLRSQGDSVASALTGGYQLAFLVAAGLIGVAILLATFVLRSDPPVREREREHVARGSRARARARVGTGGGGLGRRRRR